MIKTLITGAACALALSSTPLHAQTCLTTEFNGTNGGSQGGCVYFDMKVIQPVRILSLETNYDASVGSTVGMKIYTTPTTYAGKEANKALWTQVGQDDGNSRSAGLGNRTKIVLAAPVVLTPGTYGIALESVGDGHRYSNGNATNGKYTNAFLELTLGTATNLPFSGTPFSPRTWNGSICYVPGDGLYPSFDATPTSGTRNLKVTFTDTSFTSRPGGILNAAWDFGDGSPPVSGKVVTHTYTCGVFSPKLTVLDSREAKSLTKKDLIDATDLDADFTASRQGGFLPLVVQFTDTSTGSPTSWAWDFGDGNTSTQQNPSHTYTTKGKFTVKLTASTSCNTSTETKVGLIAAGEACLTTTFASNSGGNTNWGNYFDVDVKNAMGLKVLAMEVNSLFGRGTVAIDVYTTPVSYAPVSADASKWIKVASGSATSAAPNKPTRIDVNDFYLPPGKWGMLVQFTSGALADTRGTGCPGNQCYSNPDLALSLGVSRTALFGGVMLPARVWNGSICYARDTEAAAGAIGFGCAGTNGLVPVMTLDQDPALGATVKIDVTNMINTASGPMWLFLGVASNTGLDLTPLGAPGCRLFANPTLVTLPLVNAGGKMSLTGTVPNTPSLAGAIAALTAANVDAGANTLGAAATGGHALRIGN